MRHNIVINRAVNLSEKYFNMTRYQICETVLESNLLFPELLTAKSEKAEFSFQLFQPGNFAPTQLDWLHHRKYPDGEIWLSIGQLASGYLLRFPTIADFRITAESKKIFCYAALNSAPETIRHLFLDLVIPLLFNQLGRVVLHAGAVLLPQGAIAFMGATGWGKSTLTASFVAQGLPLLTDDCLLLSEHGENIFGVPSYPSLRLWSDNLSGLFEQTPTLAEVSHGSEKKRVIFNNSNLAFHTAPTILRRIYVLNSTEEAAPLQKTLIAPISPQLAFIELVKHTFQIGLSDRERLKKEFDFLNRIASLNLVYSIRYPRELSFLPSVRKAILANLKQ